MKFGRVAVTASAGMILAHSVKAKGISLRKGEVVGFADAAALERAGIATIVGARLEPGDVGENAAAAALAARLAGLNVRLEAAFTGRCNLLAARAGLSQIEPSTIDAANAVDEAITVATLTPMRPLAEGEMIATVKVIPFAVPGAILAAGLAAIPRAAVSIAPFRPLRVGVVSTLLPGLKAATLTKTLHVLEARLVPAGAAILRETRVPHDARPLAQAIRDLADADLLVVFGASAITDRRDVVPAGLEMAGGEVLHLGMPVDPGNLLMMGRLAREGRAALPVIGAPGCARSPKENGFDSVLWRLLAGLEVTPRELRGMGVGGLLTEIASRPQLRQADPS